MNADAPPIAADDFDSMDDSPMRRRYSTDRSIARYTIRLLGGNRRGIGVHRRSPH